MIGGDAVPGHREARADDGRAQGYAGMATTSPFYIMPQHVPQLAATAGGAGGPAPAATGGLPSSGFPDPAYYAYLTTGSSGGSGGMQPAGSSYVMSLQDQQALSSGQLPSLGGQHVTYVEVGSAGGLPIMVPQQYAQPQLSAGLGQPQPSQQMSQQLSQGTAVSGGQPAAGGGGAAAASKPRQRPKRPYKPPTVVAAERKQKNEANEYIRRLEQQLGKARSELERLQRENKTLQRKAVVLSKHTSFRRCAAGMVQELQESMTLGAQLEAMDSSQGVLDAAEKGLPEPQVLDRLRRMTTADAIVFYNGVVDRVRQLLQQIEQGGNPGGAQQQLDDIFALKDKASTFGFLQVVNPPVYAELMQAKLDPASPVERGDPSHWRAVVAAMALSEEQESQLILLLQSYSQQAEQIVAHKSRVMQELAEELSNDLLSLELSQNGSAGDAAELRSEGSADGDSGDGGSGGEQSPSPDSASAKAQQAKDELDRLVQLEYWLKFDFTGCVRKLLPPLQQAACMVHSWPFYPDHRQLEAAIRERAGPLWDQLARSAQ